MDVRRTLIALAILAYLLTLASHGNFARPQNLTNICRQVSVVGVLAVGMTLVILTGGIDLSVGSLVGLSGVVAALLATRGGLSPSVAALLTMACGLAIGLWNGYFIAVHRIPSFVITLGMMTIARGTALLLSGGMDVAGLPAAFRTLGSECITPLWISEALVVCAFLPLLTRRAAQARGRGPEAFGSALTVPLLALILALHAFRIDGIPRIFAVLLVLAAAAHVMVEHMPLGRAVVALGGNEEAASIAGLDTVGVKLFVYALMGVLSSVAGILLTARLEMAGPMAGAFLELDAITAVVIGGTRLSGGFGGIPGTMVGLLLVGSLANGMNLMDVPTFYQQIVRGLVITAAVWYDTARRR